VIPFPQATGAACALALALSGCGSEGTVARGNRTLVDMAGRTVVLPDSVKRVCSNGFSLNQLLLMLGVAPRLCATTEAVRQAPWFRRLAPQVDTLPQPFPGEAGGDPEALLRIHPDLVVLWNDDGFAARLREAGVAVLVVRFSKPEEMDSGVRLLGAALGGDASRRAARWCSLRDSVDSLVRSRTADLPEASRRNVYYAADDPQNTEGGPSLVTSWIARAGGRNVAADIPTVRAQVAMEQILSWDPQEIVCRDDAVCRRILSDPMWKRLSAVQAGKVRTCPRGVTAWCTRSGEAALQPLWAASILHPERFEDVRLDSLAARFFRDFYDDSPDASEIASILSGTVPAWGDSR
jgi:iron complex transport system substrate-binding protein